MRFLLARPDHLGDVLLTLPAASALKRAAPGSTITYLVAPGTADAPRLSPDVDEVMTVAFPAPNEERRSTPDVVAGEAERLRGRFDAAAVLRPRDGWSASIAAAAAVPVRAGVATDATQGLLTHARAEPARTHAVLLAWLVVRDAASALGLGVAMPVLESAPAPIPSGAERAVDSIVGPAPAVLHPGSGWPLKNWPADRWIALARALRDDGEILVVGGPGEEGLARAVAASAEVRAVVGLPLASLAALHRRASVVVSTDSGAVHLAAMCGAPVVGIYGPGDPAVAAPWCPDDRARVVRVDLPCSPCGVMERPPCGAQRHPACVTGVDVDAVVRAVRDVGRRAAAAASG